MIDQSRLEATNAPANPNRPRRKPLGATFWKLYTAFLFFGPALAVFLLGYLIFNALADGGKPEAPAIQAPAPEAAPSLPASPDAVETSPGQLSTSSRIQPDGDVIYQDKAGTWLNTKRGPEPLPLIVTAKPLAIEGVKPVKGRPAESGHPGTEAGQPASPSPALAPLSAPAAETSPGQAPKPAFDLMSLGLSVLTGGSARNLVVPAPAKIAKADQFYQDANGVWRNTGAGSQAPPRSEHIYQDENGVWRNLSQSTGPDSTSPAEIADSPIASLMSGLVSQGGESGGQAPLDLLGGLLGGGAGNGGGDLGGLMGALTGGGTQGGGGDLGGLVGALMGGGGQSGGSDLGSIVGSLAGGGADSGGGDLGGLVGALMGGQGGGDLCGLVGALMGGQGGGDLSGLMGALTGGGQGSGDLSGPMNGLMSSMAPSGSGAPNATFGGETAPLNVTRARPQSFFSSPAQPPASRITPNATGLSLEGYEQFDPAKAGQIKSDWEFFNDPR